MKFISTILIILCFSLKTFANVSFDEANEAYKAGNFELAIEQYQKVLQEGDFGEVFYNLGNAYYKMGDIPNAILYYEKALKKQPNDAEIQHNLNIANVQVVDKIEPLPEFFLLTWWKQLAKQQNANQWTIQFLVLLWLSILLFVAFVFARSKARRPLFFTALSGIFIAVVILLLAITQNQFETRDSEAIIMAASVSVKSAPLNTGTDLFIIHKGLKVKIIKEENDWLNIQLADGKDGWIQKNMLEVI
ncbi:MAG: tetratricopeptide repeat protein [Chitinophagales bacterium]